MSPLEAVRTLGESSLDYGAVSSRMCSWGRGCRRASHYCSEPQHPPPHRLALLAPEHALPMMDILTWDRVGFLPGALKSGSPSPGCLLGQVVSHKTHVKVLALDLGASLPLEMRLLQM